MHLVDEFAKRWWYALPDWPPVNYDYAPKLRESGFIQVQDTSSLRDAAKEGFKNVVQVDTYPGVFKCAEGRLYDLRPQDSMPSLQNFQKMPTKQL